MHVFSNNAVGTLREPIPFSESFSTLMISVEEGALFAALPSNSSEGGPKQALTLTDPSEPDVYEIVYAVSRNDYSTGVNIRVERGQEGTTPRSWGTSTKVSARVTAGMLDSFMQKEPVDGRVALGAGAKVHGTSGVAINASVDRAGLVAIAGYPAVPYRIPEPRDMLKNVLAYEAVATTAVLELTTAGADVWASGYNVTESYPYIPTTPDGNQYIATFDEFPAVTWVAAGATEPTWNTTGDYTEFTEASEPGVSGRWTRFNLTEGVVLDFGAELKLFPTELGVMVNWASLGTTPPSVTIEDAASGTPLVSNQPLTSITGGWQWHRFTSIPNRAVQSLRFKVVSPGDAAYLAGRFYVKGIFVSEYNPTP